MYLTADQEQLYKDNEGLIFFSYTKYVKKMRDVKHLNDQDVQDVLQAGSIGLMQACVSYRKDLNIKFSSYAVVCILNAMKVEMRKLERHKLDSVSLEATIRMDKSVLDKRPEATMSGVDFHLAPHEDVEEKAIAHMMLDRVKYMRDPWRTVACMVMAGYTYGEIGQKLGCTKERVRQRVEDIRDALRMDKKDIKIRARSVFAAIPEI